MTDLKSQTPPQVFNALNRSGFPLQTMVADLVRRTPSCSIIAEEFPWQDHLGADHFLDLVAYMAPFVIAIECKKTQKEILTFLQPGGIKFQKRARCVSVGQIQDSTKSVELFCADWLLIPDSIESLFCVVSTSETGKDQRMLEPTAQELVRGADAYARRNKQIYFKNGKLQPELDTVIVPAIVTNAKLFVAEYKLGDVSLETGQLTAPAITAIEWVRFRKTFTSVEQDIGERTVFVVSSTSLTSWLEKLNMVSNVPDAKVRFH